MKTQRFSLSLSLTHSRSFGRFEDLTMFHSVQDKNKWIKTKIDEKKHTPETIHERAMYVRASDLLVLLLLFSAFNQHHSISNKCEHFGWDRAA